jgi:cytochrome c-type biogenesis protein CcmH
MKVARAIAAFFLALTLSLPAGAVEPGERLADPAQELRARALSAELRCLVCQNQSIDDSNAPLAKDLRVLVREQIKAGKSDGEVMGYIVARYGDFVLLRPRVTLQTALLWLTPLLILSAVGYGLWRRRSVIAPREDVAPLTADEQRRLDEIMRAKS